MNAEMHGFVSHANPKPGGSAIPHPHPHRPDRGRGTRDWVLRRPEQRIHQKCLVSVESDVTCDHADIQACVVRHIQAANGLVVDREADATLRLTSVITKIVHTRQYREYSADKVIGKFEGDLVVTDLGSPSAAKRVIKLKAWANEGD